MCAKQVFDWVYEEVAQERIDKFLSYQNEEWSRSMIQKWIKDQHVLVNGQPVKSNYKLQEHDAILVQIPSPQDVQILPQKMDLDVVYEDQDLIVINKPRGMVVHPAPGHYSDTLVNGLLAHCQDLSGINGLLRPGIVHRIDMDTSGLLMAAKTDAAHLSLSEQLKEHTVTRKYVALVHGLIQHESGTVNAPIGRDPKDRQMMNVVPTGKPAITHFQVLERFSAYTLVDLRLETGRTHQIRVHMKYIGHPLAGDPKYGPAITLEIAGQALHAKLLGFCHPRTGEQMMFEAALPQDMQKEIERLRLN